MYWNSNLQSDRECQTLRLLHGFLGDIVKVSFGTKATTITAVSLLGFRKTVLAMNVEESD